MLKINEWFRALFKKDTIGSVNINGARFSGRNVLITNNEVIIDGMKIRDNDFGAEINISIDGDCESVETSFGDVTVVGNSAKVNTMSGDVTCGNVGGNVETMSGDVDCQNVHGSVETVSGDVKCGEVAGHVETVSGDIHRRR